MLNGGKHLGDGCTYGRKARTDTPCEEKDYQGSHPALKREPRQRRSLKGARAAAGAAFLPETGVNVHDQLASVLDAETGEKPAQMGPHGRYRHAEIPGDLLVGMAQEELFYDVRLSGWQG